MSGLWVVFEGVDGSGKSTLIDAVSAHLWDLGIQSHQCAEPHHLRSQCLDESLADDPYTRQCWFALDARLNMVRDVEPALADGKVVLQDRGAWSAAVYSSLEDPLVESVGHQGDVPDLTVLVDVPPEVALQRVSERHSRAFTPALVPPVGSANSVPSTGLSEPRPSWRSEADYFDAASFTVYQDRSQQYWSQYLNHCQDYGPASAIRVHNAEPSDLDDAARQVVDRIQDLM